MENNQQLLKDKLELFFGMPLQSLEKSFEKTLGVIEEMKYMAYELGVVEVGRMGTMGKETQCIETCPTPKVPEKKNEDEAKKPKVEDTRAKTPTKAMTPAVKPRAKPNEIHKTNDKKASVKDEDHKIDNAKKAMSKTAEMKRSPTAPPPKKTVPAPKKSNTKVTSKTPKAPAKKPGLPKKEPQPQPKPTEHVEQAKEDLNQAISNIIIIPQLIPKYTYPIPSQLKTNNTIAMMYILTKTGYLLPKEKYALIVSIPLLFKGAYNSSLTFFLESKILSINNRIKEIESLFAAYGDIESYLSKAFSPTKTAQNSLTFVTKEEELNLSNREDLPKEIGLLFQLFYYIFDEPFSEALPFNQQIGNFLASVLPKYEVKDLRNLLLSFISKRQPTTTKDKYEKIDQIIKDNPKILSSIEISKINRPCSYMTFILKEIYDFLSLKTLDGVFYFELRNKNAELLELKAQLLKLQGSSGISTTNEALSSTAKEDK